MRVTEAAAAAVVTAAGGRNPVGSQPVVRPTQVATVAARAVAAGAGTVSTTDGARQTAGELKPPSKAVRLSAPLAPSRLTLMLLLQPSIPPL